jgi:hypothetical protein
VTENDVGFLSIERAAELVVVGVIDHRPAIYLRGEDGARAKNAAGVLRLGCAHGATRTRVRASAIPFAAVEVQEDDFVPRLHIARDESAAAAFRISRMTAGYNNLQTV